MRNHPTVLIVGAGAIGSFYGGKLAQAGAQVSVVCRSDYEVVKEAGFLVTSVLGDFHFMPEQVLRHADEAGKTFDYILIATKALPHMDLYRLIHSAVGPRTAIVLIQNGIGIEAALAEAFPENEIISGLAFIAVSRIAPGRINHQDYGRLTLGVYPSGVSERVETLCQLVESSGVPCEGTPEVVSARWKKLVWNAAFNPVSVLGGRLNTEDILKSAEGLHLVREVMGEVCTLAQAMGHPLPPEIIEQNIEGTRVMKAYKTSMLLDFEGGRPMEVEAILGNAVRMGRQVGVGVPRLESLYALLLLVEGQRRGHE